MGFFLRRRFCSYRSYRGDFTSRGESICGEFLFPRDESSPFPLAILCHGMGADHRAMQPCPTQMVREGIATFTFDFLGHGRSSGVMDGNVSPEVKAAYHNAAAHPWVDKERIALVGHSMGAMGVIHALPELDNVCAVVIISCPPEEKLSEEDEFAIYAQSHFEEESKAVFEYPRDGLMPGFGLFRGIFSWFWMRLRGYRMRINWGTAVVSRMECSLLASLRNRNRCPLLWVICGGDRRIPPEGVLMLYQHTPEPKKLLYTKGFHSTPLLPGKTRQQWIAWLVSKLNCPSQGNLCR